MRILITTAGSRGDVQPYVALGQGLVEAGHAVTICTHARFEGFVTEHKLGYAHLSNDLLGLMESSVGRGALEDMGSLVSGVKTAVRLLRRSGEIQRGLVRDGWAAAQAVGPDLIVYNSKMFGAPHYAEKLGVPAALAMLFAQFVPTAAFPSLGFPRWPLGSAYNRLTYRIVQGIAARIAKKYVAEWRSAHGLPPHRTGLLRRSDGTPIPVLHGFSRHLVPRPADWPSSAVVTGTWFLDWDEEWTPPPTLAAFLDEGEPPVYVGFGSMAGRDPERTTQIVVEALQQVGLRGVLATGWGGLAPSDLPDTVFALDRVPHDWLFPRVAAVVHHGGAGTTAAGLRAGCPTVICPFFGDQPFWGGRVHALGVGSAPIPQKDLSAEKLAAALREVTADPLIRQRAQTLGEAIRQEDGIARAVAATERVYRSGGRSA